MAKPLANGYPIGAVLLRDSIASTMTPGKARGFNESAKVTFLL